MKIEEKITTQMKKKSKRFTEATDEKVGKKDVIMFTIQ